MEWFEKRFAYLLEREERNSRVVGEHKRVARDRAHSILLEELGWSGDTDSRRIFRWRNEVDENHEVDLALIEDALELVGVELGELYPYIIRDERMFERYCATCAEIVTTGIDLCCPWCETLTVSSVICPSCGGRKSGTSKFCIACVPRDEHGHHARRGDVSDHCPGCGGPKSRFAITCWTCYAANGSHTGRRVRKCGPQNMSDALLEEARHLYDEGLSMREVASRIWPQTGYASARSCASSLFQMFGARGWPLRDRAAATAEANRKRAFRPQCSFVKASGVRCEKQSIGEDGRCWHHKPENMARGLARLRELDQSCP